jgi:ABC-type bacteriocin/lantibiotic exporter with double-glycine peptidase domain
MIETILPILWFLIFIIVTYSLFKTCRSLAKHFSKPSKARESYLLEIFSNYFSAKTSKKLSKLSEKIMQHQAKFMTLIFKFQIFIFKIMLILTVLTIIYEVIMRTL